VDQRTAAVLKQARAALDANRLFAPVHVARSNQTAIAAIDALLADTPAVSCDLCAESSQLATYLCPEHVGLVPVLTFGSHSQSYAAATWRKTPDPED
jgi:hypothetical protein